MNIDFEFSGKNLIGNDRSGEGSVTFRAVDPHTGEETGPEFYEATEQEVSRAVTRAVSAFDDYCRMPGNRRAEFLEMISDEIMALGDSLIHACMTETGLPFGRFKGERARTVNQLKMFAKVVREGSWIDARIDRAEDERPGKPDVRSMLRPLGPVGIFGASNFPLAFSVAGGDTASALAAGCPVVVKAHPAHPMTCEMIGRAILNAGVQSGMPEGVFSMVHGISHRAGMGIVRHPGIRAIGFTGSFRGGKAIYDAACARAVPIPVYAEMGSTNPVFVLPGALAQRRQDVAKGLSGSVTLGVGQFCTNPGIVIAADSDASQEFKKELADQISGSQTDVMLTEGIRDAFNAGSERLLAHASVELLAEGRSGESGFATSPRVFGTTGSAFLENGEFEEEVFGPSTLLVSAEHSAQLIDIAQKLSGHLTATVIGTDEDLRANRQLIGILEDKVGRIIINGYPTGVEVSHAMVHGGPFPSTTDSRTTSVGTAAIFRFARPVCYQDFPDELLPDELKDSNPLGLSRQESLVR